MKFNENLVNRISEAIEYSIKVTPKVREGFESFFRTINVFNVVLEDGGYRKMIKAADGFDYHISDYQIISVLKELILPEKVAVLSQDALAVDARSSIYYRDNELTDASIMTPAQFKAFQQGLFFRMKVTPESFQKVSDLKAVSVSVADVANRLAVYKGYNSLLATVVEALGFIESDIVTEVPTAAKFPIVVSSWYKNEVAYSYSAEDAVVHFFSEVVRVNC